MLPCRWSCQQHSLAQHQVCSHSKVNNSNTWVVQARHTYTTRGHQTCPQHRCRQPRQDPRFPAGCNQGSDHDAIRYQQRDHKKSNDTNQLTNPLHLVLCSSFSPAPHPEQYMQLVKSWLAPPWRDAATGTWSKDSNTARMPAALRLMHWRRLTSNSSVDSASASVCSSKSRQGGV